MSDTVIEDMIAFFQRKVRDMFLASERMMEDQITTELGYFLRGVAESYEQTWKWAEEVLTRPIPDRQDEAGLAAWITCYRVFRRQLRTFGNHLDFDHSWFEDDPEPVREALKPGHLGASKLSGSAS